jgi:antirestriction protein ArdC
MLRKGGQGFPVVFWKRWEGAELSEGRKEERTKTRRIPLARLYYVFNVQQCELPARLQPSLQIKPEHSHPRSQLVVCEHILVYMPDRPVITHHAARAYFYWADERGYMFLTDNFC